MIHLGLRGLGQQQSRCQVGVMGPTAMGAIVSVGLIGNDGTGWIDVRTQRGWISCALGW